METVLKRLDMMMCKPIDTPISKSKNLSNKQGPTTQEDKAMMWGKPYIQVVGSIMYATLYTRPDVAFAVGLVSRFLSNLGLSHWYAVKRILRYIKGTLKLQLCYQGDDLKLCGYFDAYWASDLDKRKSTTGYVYTLGGGAISWGSKKQTSTPVSTVEAEYIACSTAIQEAVWLRSFFIWY